MAIILPKLPYANIALSPHISEKTLDFHYGKHHSAYVDKLNSLIVETELVDETLENIISKTANNVAKSAIFNNAAQVWNHNFYWQSMKAGGGGLPFGPIAQKIKIAFGGYEKFAEDFRSVGLAQFGSGWVWLIIKEGNLEIMKTSNADNPIAHGLKPLVTADVWEHAYYLDYQNRRSDYLDVFIKHLINWDFVNSRIG